MTSDDQHQFGSIILRRFFLSREEDTEFDDGADKISINL
jgi:hypothetical protein